MLNISQMKADAEEGLRIAEKATKGPWADKRRTIYDSAGAVLAKCWPFKNQRCPDAKFIADSRTRAPNAYRNVIALVAENEKLRERLALHGIPEVHPFVPAKTEEAAP